MIVDLSHEIVAGMVTYPGIAPPSLQITTTRADSAARLGTGASFEIDSRLMKHLQDIAAFLVEEKRIPAAPSDWPGLFNTQTGELLGDWQQLAIKADNLFFL